jgi:hypothetical protein
LIGGNPHSSWIVDLIPTFVPVANTTGGKS